MKNIRVLVKGLMNQDWEDWFSGFSLAYTPAGETALSGPIRDQAELRGLVTRIADLGLELVSIETEHFEERPASNTATGSGNTGTADAPPRERGNKTCKEGNMKRKLYLVPVALVLAFTSVVAGVFYGRSGESVPTTDALVAAVEQPVDLGQSRMPVEQVMGIYGFLDDYHTAVTARQVMALYGYWDEFQAAIAAEQRAGAVPEPMTVEQIKALYGYVEEPQAVGQRAGTDPGPMTVDQTKALYGYVEEPGPEIWELEIVPPIYTYPWYIRP